MTDPTFASFRRRTAQNQGWHVHEDDSIATRARQMQESLVVACGPKNVTNTASTSHADHIRANKWHMLYVVVSEGWQRSLPRADAAARTVRGPRIRPEVSYGTSVFERRRRGRGAHATNR